VQPKPAKWKFVEDRREPVYPTLASELDAIQQGKKTISFFATDRKGVDEDLAALQRLALVRKLCITIAPRGKVIDLFVHRAENAGRIKLIQSHLSLGPWSVQSEAKIGALLGYSAAERTAWQKAEHHARPAFGVLTLYGSMVDGYGVPKWWWTEPGRVLAPDAYAKRPPNLQLWRVGAHPRYAKKLDPKGHVMLAGSARKQKAFDDAVRTPYEMLGPKGWRRVKPTALK
jgi:hypothetical protein